MLKKSKVIIVHGKNIINGKGQVNQNKIFLMFAQGLRSITSQENVKNSFKTIFPDDKRIGIKINTIGGRKISTRPGAAHSLARLISECDVPKKSIFIWDRTNRELREAGYRLNRDYKDINVFGTDTKGIGYDLKLISHKNIGSLFSKIQSKLITSSISFAILKDHGLAGVTASMKNYFGSIHNPNKYHDTSCNPFIPELFETKYIKNKHKLSILDCLIVQYHRGPSFHSQWAEKTNTIVFGLDPVATDCIGWKIIENLRAKKGLPSLKEEKREPVYLKTAEKMGLGTTDLDKISIIEKEI